MKEATSERNRNAYDAWDFGSQRMGLAAGIMIAYDLEGEDSFKELQNKIRTSLDNRKRRSQKPVVEVKVEKTREVTFLLNGREVSSAECVAWLQAHEKLALTSIKQEPGQSSSKRRQGPLVGDYPIKVEASSFVHFVLSNLPITSKQSQSPGRAFTSHPVSSGKKLKLEEEPIETKVRFSPFSFSFSSLKTLSFSATGSLSQWRLTEWLCRPPPKYEALNSGVFRRFDQEGGGRPSLETFRPYAMAANSKGHIIVADAGNHCLQVFDQNGTFLSKIPAIKEDLEDILLHGEDFTPCGVAINPQTNEIVVSDERNHQILVFDEKGSLARHFGGEGEGDEEFNRPTGVAFDAKGNVVVADKNNHRVQVFDATGTINRTLDFGTEAIWGPTGVGMLSDGRFVVAGNDDSRLLVVDEGKQAVQVIDAVSWEGPWHLFVDSKDNILVSDYKANAFHVLDKDGLLKKTVLMGSRDGPTGICVGIKGEVLVAAFGEGCTLAYRSV